MELSPKFEEALVYATRVHGGQLRKKTKIPYIGHLLGVSAIAMEYGANETEAIAALLHDAVEDCGGPERQREIEEKFGRAVGEIVAGCTDTDQMPKPPWRERKEKYIAHLETASASTRLVSAADKLHNAQAIVHNLREEGDEVWSRFKRRKRRRTLVLSRAGHSLSQARSQRVDRRVGPRCDGDGETGGKRRDSEIGGEC